MPTEKIKQAIRDLIDFTYQTGYLAGETEHTIYSENQRKEFDLLQKQVIEARKLGKQRLEDAIDDLLAENKDDADRLAVALKACTSMLNENKSARYDNVLRDSYAALAAHGMTELF